jgi:hypothetical protein
LQKSRDVELIYLCTPLILVTIRLLEMQSQCNGIIDLCRCNSGSLLREGARRRYKEEVQGGGTRRRKVGGETHTFDQSSTASHHKTAVRKTTHDGISSNLSIEPLGDKPTLDGPSSVVRWTKPFLFLLPMNTPVDFMISVELTSGLLELSHLRKPQLRCL